MSLNPNHLRALIAGILVLAVVIPTPLPAQFAVIDAANLNQNI